MRTVSVSVAPDESRRVQPDAATLQRTRSMVPRQLPQPPVIPRSYSFLVDIPLDDIVDTPSPRRMLPSIFGTPKTNILDRIDRMQIPTQPHPRPPSSPLRLLPRNTSSSRLTENQTSVPRRNMSTACDTRRPLGLQNSSPHRRQSEVPKHAQDSLLDDPSTRSTTPTQQYYQSFYHSIPLATSTPFVRHDRLEPVTPLPRESPATTNSVPQPDDYIVPSRIEGTTGLTVAPEPTTPNRSYHDSLVSSFSVPTDTIATIICDEAKQTTNIPQTCPVFGRKSTGTDFGHLLRSPCPPYRFSPQPVRMKTSQSGQQNELELEEPFRPESQITETNSNEAETIDSILGPGTAHATETEVIQQSEILLEDVPEQSSFVSQRHQKRRKPSVAPLLDPPPTKIRVIYKKPIRKKGKLVAYSDLDPRRVWMKIMDEPLLPDPDDDEADLLLLTQSP